MPNICRKLDLSEIEAYIKSGNYQHTLGCKSMVEGPTIMLIVSIGLFIYIYSGIVPIYMH